MMSFQCGKQTQKHPKPTARAQTQTNQTTQKPKKHHIHFFPSYASVALARSSHNVCADERIRQCMSKHPTLGSRKWSADHYVVLSPLQGDNEKENQQNTEPKTNQAAKAKKTPNHKRNGHPVMEMPHHSRQLVCR